MADFDLSSLTQEELRTLTNRINRQMAKNNQQKYRAGTHVSWSKNGAVHRGSVVKANKVNLSLLENTGKKWRVHPNFVKYISPPRRDSVRRVMATVPLPTKPEKEPNLRDSEW